MSGSEPSGRDPSPAPRAAGRGILRTIAGVVSLLLGVLLLLSSLCFGLFGLQPIYGGSSAKAFIAAAVLLAFAAGVGYLAVRLLRDRG